MAIYIFRSGKDPQQFAVAFDPSAPRLPQDHEPWKFARLERIRSRVDYINLAKAETDIQSAGFHLCRDLPLNNP
jgi:hypothetical protein